MHEQNFEKQVRERMDELSFTPSAPVWQKVEEGIKPERKRRRALLWLPLLLVGAGLGTWLLREPAPSRQQEALSSGTTAIPARPQAPVPAGAPTPEPSGTATGAPGSGTAPERSAAPAAPGKETTTASETTAPAPRLKNTPDPSASAATPFTARTNPVLSRAARTGSGPSGRPAGRGAKPQRNPGTVPGEQATATRKTGINDEVADIVLNETRVPPVAAPELETAAPFTPVTDSVAQGPAPEVMAALDSATQPESLPVTPEAKRKAAPNRRWQFAVYAQAGHSSQEQGLLSQLGGAKSADDLMAYADRPGNIPGNNFFAVPPPSPVRSGKAFIAGAEASRRTGRRSALKAGLQYSFFTSQIRIGSPVEPSAVGMRPAGMALLDADKRYNNAALPGAADAHTYINRYHYLELPLAYRTQPLKRFPLEVEAGVSVTRFLGSNALHYVSGYYYNDNSLFRKTGFSFSSALHYPVLTSKAGTLLLSPRFQYGLSSILRESRTGDQHFLFLGAGVTFRR
ncbi:MAG TPA: hypothetical protein VHK69_06895 [Chitinophagaceae bacterium]|jgi:hypothetical protein|nr:hypothetical protein [Chitinophagaceae bacterium]